MSSPWVFARFPLLWFHPILAGLVPVWSFGLDDFSHQTSCFAFAFFFLPLWSPLSVWMWMCIVWVLAGVGDMPLSLERWIPFSASVCNLTTDAKAPSWSLTSLQCSPFIQVWSSLLCAKCLGSYILGQEDFLSKLFLYVLKMGSVIWWCFFQKFCSTRLQHGTTK